MERYPGDDSPLVRPYLLTGGRSRPARTDLELITLVVAVSEEIREAVGPEQAEIVRLCQEPCSVAEVSALLNLPLMVVKVLLSDLIDRGHLIHRPPPPTTAVPSRQLLQAVLDGIRRL
ncbi:DUF742 domain-containing protein [Amycolatopsis acidicola]|uniref:DUF742 domain-containing protein n=1 Tax=Amycolatopsis acidicola TaxID=2596893 RepID=A0A5N0V9J3_9PSEU|nr:DUF742 domain-containing protein [Amycolatopsis acidicola]KAA9161651.1 DUF742 domain-containing protein [Amycolatopsis acidicola]